MSKKKAKVKETLSKQEKELIAKMREIAKRDNEQDYIMYKKFYEEIILEYELKIDDFIKRAKDSFMEGFNEIFKIQEFSEFDQLSKYVEMYQIIFGMKPRIEIENENFLKAHSTEIKEIFIKKADEIEEDIETGFCLKKGVTERSLDIVKEECRRSKLKTVDKVLSSSKEAEESCFKSIENKIDNMMEMVRSTLDLVNDFLKIVKKKDNDLNSFFLYESDVKVKVEISGLEVGSIALASRMNRCVSNYANREEIKEIEEKIKKAVGDYSFIGATSAKLDNGKTLKWSKDGFAIDNSTIVDKSYSYKELNHLAIKAGYKLDRGKGDHFIYTKDGENHVVIPQKTLGKGLQLKILKDLKII